MIVVEGPDGAGKTMLVQALASKFDVPIAPRVVSKDTEVLVDMMAWVHDNVRAGWQRRIYDRHRLISDPIYRFIIPVKEDDFEFYDYVWLSEQVEIWVKDVQPIVIFCLPDWPTVLGNLKREGDRANVDNSVVIPHMAKIYQDYVAAASVWRLLLGDDFIHHDYTDPLSREHVMQTLERFLA